MTTKTLVATPDPPGRRDLTTRQLVRLSRHRGCIEVELYEHQLDNDFKVAIDQMDTDALAEALNFDLDEEFRMVDRIRTGAQGDPLKAELGARKLETFTSSNLARARRFSRSL
jgi:hypothetical protein